MTEPAALDRPLRTSLTFLGRWFVLAVAASVLVMALWVWADVASSQLARDHLDSALRTNAPADEPTPEGKVFSY